MLKNGTLHQRGKAHGPSCKCCRARSIVDRGLAAPHAIQISPSHWPTPAVLAIGLTASQMSAKSELKQPINAQVGWHTRAHRWERPCLALRSLSAGSLSQMEAECHETRQLSSSEPVRPSKQSE